MHHSAKTEEILATSPELLDGMVAAFHEIGLAFPVSGSGFASVRETSPASL